MTGGIAVAMLLGPALEPSNVRERRRRTDWSGFRCSVKLGDGLEREGGREFDTLGSPNDCDARRPGGAFVGGFPCSLDIPAFINVML